MFSSVVLVLILGCLAHNLQEISAKAAHSRVYSGVVDSPVKGEDKKDCPDSSEAAAFGIREINTMAQGNVPVVVRTLRNIDTCNHSIISGGVSFSLTVSVLACEDNYPYLCSPQSCSMEIWKTGGVFAEWRLGPYACY